MVVGSSESGLASLARIKLKEKPDPKHLAIALGKVSGESGELSIPIEHDTAAHKLLRWPSIFNLVSRVTQDEKYAGNGELLRGEIRLYGCGEGKEWSDELGYRTSYLPPHPYYRELPGGPTTTQRHQAWGVTGFAPLDPRQPQNHDRIGGLNADGSLKLDGPTLTRLLDSYLANIHVMHPILNKQRLREGFHEFSQLYGNLSAHHAVDALDPTMSSSYDGEPRRGTSGGLLGKRKRSDERPYLAPPLPPNNLQTAVNLLVAALGKICEHKEFLPALPKPPSEPPEPVDVNLALNGSLDEPHQLPSPPTSQASSLDEDSSVSPPLDARHSPQRPAPAGANVDVIPGLAYYTMAVAILGTRLVASEMMAVQAFLLAGLYAGQLARVHESYKWICLAAQACHHLIVP
jgi:hypothetical protein